MVYSAIADSEIDPESPGTTTLFTKLRDNPEGIATAASGATKIVLAALADEAKPALVHLSTQTASVSSEITFTSLIDSTYDNFIFKFTKIVPATNGDEFQVQLSSDNGSTWIADGNYVYILSGTPSAAANFWILSDNVNSTASRGLSGDLSLFSPSAATNTDSVHNTFYYNATTAAYTRRADGAVYAATTAINAVRFYMSTGNITSGIISLYGVKK